MTTAYPTPPFSPSSSEHNTKDNSLRSTMSLLDSLVDFYQEKRIWVDRTRVNLAHGDASDRNDSERLGKRLRDSDLRSSRWTYRKNELGLRLDRISSTDGGREYSLQQKEHILELFDRMIETRMESCQRVNDLLRQAARRITVRDACIEGTRGLLYGDKQCTTVHVGQCQPSTTYYHLSLQPFFMPNRYAPVPNPRSEHPARDEIEHEMRAAFDYSEDEEELDNNDEAESRPLNPAHASPSPSPSRSMAAPGTYDFENLDYDRPPPGSPPRPSASALPNEHGNTNGLIPNFNGIPRPSRQNWLQRSAAQVLPSILAERLGLHHGRPAGTIGSGVQNDGVFANVTAKPSAPVRIQEGDETYIVPEDSRNEAPPSYAAAQADAVPPYWDTTVHAPFAPDAMGDMIIDSLPTGSLFSFLWNMLISVSFQFVGFLLTYLLHTTHAARFGSRAGLGVTLIQYGFALRSRLENEGEQGSWGTWKQPQPAPTGSPYNTNYNTTMPNVGSTAPNQTNSLFAQATTEWLSFFLMTIGWFILLTSVLGFWRVKRWERVLASQRDPQTAATAVNAHPSQGRVLFDLATPLSSILGRRRADDVQTSALSHAEEGVADRDDARETDAMLSGADADGNNRRLTDLAYERQLRENLRAAGFV